MRVEVGLVLQRNEKKGAKELEDEGREETGGELDRFLWRGTERMRGSLTEFPSLPRLLRRDERF